MFSLFATQYFWLALGASAINSALLCVTVGIAAKTHGGSLIAVLLLLVVGSQLLSCLYFLSGKGTDLAVRRFLDEDRLHAQSTSFQAVTNYMKRYRRLYIFMYRFIPGLRFISPYIMGLQGQRFWPFFFVDWLAALLWASVFGVLGFLFGAAVLRVLDDFADYDGYIFGAVAAPVLLYALIRQVERRHRWRRGEALSPGA